MKSDQNHTIKNATSSTLNMQGVTTGWEVMTQHFNFTTERMTLLLEWEIRQVELMRSLNVYKNSTNKRDIGKVPAVNKHPKTRCNGFKLDSV